MVLSFAAFPDDILTRSAGASLANGLHVLFRVFATDSCQHCHA